MKNGNTTSCQRAFEECLVECEKRSVEGVFQNYFHKNMFHDVNSFELKFNTWFHGFTSKSFLVFTSFEISND